MPNTIITPSIIAAEGLFHLENHLVFGGLVHRDYKNEFVKIGESVTIRKPVKFVVSKGATRVNQDVIENTTSVTIDVRDQVSWSFSTQELTMRIAEYSDRYIKPACIALANEMDLAVATEGAQKFFNRAGDVASDPSTFGAVSAVARRMDDQAVPDDGRRNLVVNAAARWGLAEGLGTTNNQSIFNPDIVGPMVRRGYLGDIAGLKIHGNQNIIAQQSGSRGTGASAVGLVNEPSGVTVGDTTIAFDTASASVANYLRVGDVITFAGVNAVNPVSRQDTGQLAEFVVTANVTTSGAAGTISVYPEFNDGSVTSTAAYQNITALPANNAGITVAGGTAGPAASATVPQNLGFHENALALVSVPLELPRSAEFKARAQWRGVSIRVIMAYDVANDDEIIRLDTFYGTDAIYPELGVRLYGAG